MAEDTAATKQPEQSQATIEAGNEANPPECSDSSIKNPEACGISSTAEESKSLELANELMEKGSISFKEGDYSDAADLFSRALETRVAHYGELAPECIRSYYKYGLVLLNKAQEEADPLGAVPKKDAKSQQGSLKIGGVKNNADSESSIASVSSNNEQCASSNQLQGVDDVAENGPEDKDEESDVEELDEVEEDESDLDLAWKMLDLARAIAEKHSIETVDMVDILSALAEVSLEREDIDTALSDYEKALSILERLVEPDSRYIAELNFRICLTLEIGSKAHEAIPYCQRAISVCKTRMQRLMDEVKGASDSTSTTGASEVDEGDDNNSIGSKLEKSVSDKKAEIETLSSLSTDLEKKLEDLQQLESNPTSILSDILGLVAAKARANEQTADSSARLGASNNNGDFSSPTVSTAHSNGTSGVTHLGVVGRGVKRVRTNAGNVESSASKKPDLDPKPDTDNSSGF